MNKEILAALSGLEGAINNNGKTKKSDELVLRSLAALNEKLDAAELQACIDSVHADKFTLSPNCASCDHPCGNTSDYDLTKEADLDAEILEGKERMAAALAKKAKELSESGMASVGEETMALIHKAVAYWGYDLAPHNYEKLIGELQGGI